MSDTIKLRDTISGEVLTLKLKDTTPIKKDKPQAKESYSEKVGRLRAETTEEIAKRGSYWGGIKENLMSPNPVKRTLGVLGVVGAPFAALEGAVANPSLALQRGEVNPLALAKEAYLGATGKKQGQYGDVYRDSGFVPKPVAAGAGLLLNVSPIKALQTVNKTFGAIKKLSDKGIIKAGESLIKATQEATKVTGVGLEKAYQPLNNITVNSKAVKSLLDKMPSVLRDEITQRFSGVNFANPTVAVVREIKQIIGKYKPNVFGKGERGIAENIEAARIEQLYAMTKKIINSVVESRVGKKAAEVLSKTDDAFHSVSNASDYIQKSIIDATLKQATKAGSMAKKIAIEGDVSGRAAMNVLKRSGARKEINKAMDALQAFNKWQAIHFWTQKGINAALFGGVAGSIGGQAMRKVSGED